MSRDYQSAHVVKNVSEEYEYIKGRLCDCGGHFTVWEQALVENENKYYDILRCKCQQCEKEVEFIFDINSFFGKWS